MNTTTRTDELTATLQSEVALIQRLVAPLSTDDNPSLEDVRAIARAMFVLRDDVTRALRTALDLCEEMDR